MPNNPKNVQNQNKLVTISQNDNQSNPRNANAPQTQNKENHAIPQTEYTITELSKRFSIKPSTIRYYEQIGLLENVEHVTEYKRIYNASHIERLEAINCFKKALFTLNEIQNFFEYEKDITGNARMILELMKNQEEKTIQAISDLEDGLKHIQKKIRYYSAIEEAVKAGGPIPCWEDY